jgi:hypothetical protein
MIFIVPTTEAQIRPQVKFLPQLENQLQPENVQEINLGNGNDLSDVNGNHSDSTEGGTGIDDEVARLKIELRAAHIVQGNFKGMQELEIGKKQGGQREGNFNLDTKWGLAQLLNNPKVQLGLTSFSSTYGVVSVGWLLWQTYIRWSISLVSRLER